MSHHDIDDPARKVAEAEVATVPLSSTPTESARPERTRLPAEDLADLSEELITRMRGVNTRILAEAVVIKGIVAKTAPRLSEIDEEVFPWIPIVGQDGQVGLRRLLEVPGSGYESEVPFYYSDTFQFPSIATYITPEGTLANFAVTRRSREKRVVYNRGFEISLSQIMKFKDGIFKALDSAAYRGVVNPKNHRPKPPKG